MVLFFISQLVCLDTWNQQWSQTVNDATSQRSIFKEGVAVILQTPIAQSGAGLLSAFSLLI